MSDSKTGGGKIKVTCFSISLDGYGAGPSQNKENPLGVRGTEVHTWIFPTKAFRKMSRQDDGTEGIDNDLVEKSFENIGAWIMGRNMFGPVRGNWTDDEWKGWWGDNPPYHAPVFVLTHEEREPIEMEGGTTFIFVTDGIESALSKAKEAAGDRNVKIMGGANTINQYLAAGLIDELWIHIVPVTVGAGSRSRPHSWLVAIARRVGRVDLGRLRRLRRSHAGAQVGQ